VRVLNNIRTKICGITREQDLKAAEEYGADLIGFIHVKRSPRFLEMDDIKYLVSLLNDKNRAVLVLEPENVQQAKYKILESGINTVQLHSLTPLEIKELKIELENSDVKNDLKDNCLKFNVIKAIGLHETISTDKKNEIESFATECDGILLDYQLSGKSGGTGKQIPLDIALKGAEIAQNANKNIEIYLAGGMSADRIKTEAKMIKNVFDVADFNSALEDEPGKKNKSKIKDLFDQIKKLNTV
jgi:phosphoribosylanthranilate isomerase